MSPPTPRRGLVLGAGGVLGFAWAVGALTAVQEATGWDPRQAEVLVGTSAGSVTAAMLASKFSVAAMLNHQRGRSQDGDPSIDYDYDRDSGGAWPPRPSLRMGSRNLLVRAALHPRRITPLAALTSVLPQGRGTVPRVGAIVDGLVRPGAWTEHPATWIVAMDYETGRRVPFGRQGSPPAGLSEAVTASCAIPGWYTPVVIGGRRYVDGGACSATSLDLLAGRGLDEVVVIAPMAATGYDSPSTVAGRLERRFRRLVSKRVAREAAKVRGQGTKVTLLAPGPEDLAAIGVNMMNYGRRVAVLETSLRTSAAALRDGNEPGLAEVG